MAIVDSTVGNKHGLNRGVFWTMRVLVLTGLLCAVCAWAVGCNQQVVVGFDVPPSHIDDEIIETGSDSMVIDSEIIDSGMDSDDVDIDAGLDTETELDMSTDSSEDLDASVDSDEDALCPPGSTIRAINVDAGFARMGSVFSTTQFDPDITSNNQTHNPEPIGFEVLDKEGHSVVGCPVLLMPGNGCGWVFPSEVASDAQGKVEAWWTAGYVENHVLTARINTDDGTISSAQVTGIAEPHLTRSTTTFADFSVTGPYEGIAVNITPLTFPATTFYSALSIPGAFCGFQNKSNTNEPSLEDKWVLFSVWDTATAAVEIVDTGAAQCDRFEELGTGVKCTMVFDWQIDVTYQFWMDLTTSVEGTTDYSLMLKDPTESLDEWITVATLRYGEEIKPSIAGAFVQNWGDWQDSCLENESRKLYISNIQEFVDGQWLAVREATFRADYFPNRNEVCKNYYYGVQGSMFLWSTGGDSLVGPPLMEDEPYPLVVLE